MEENKIVEPTGFYPKLVVFTLKNKKSLLIGGLVILVLAVGFTLYDQYVLEPKKKQSQEMLAKIQEYFRVDSFDLVVNGGMGLKGAVKISSEYSGTKAGNLANYYAGVGYLKLGEYDNAIKYLKKFKSNDDMIIGSLALACIGDAYVEKSDFKEALKYYIKAVDYNINELTTPVHTRKALNVYIELNNYDDALKLVGKLLDNEKVPDAFKNELKKYKGLIEAKSGKFDSDVNS